MLAIVLAVLVLYIERTRIGEETAPVFELAELGQLNQSRMKQLEVSTDTRVLTTRLKHRLFAQFPGMQAHNKERDFLMALEEDVDAALATVCVLDSDSNAVHLACAAHIVRCEMFREAMPFNGFPERCQEESVPSLLLGLVSMILEDPSIIDQMADSNYAALAGSQILKFNSIRHKRLPTNNASQSVHNCCHR